VKTNWTGAVVGSLIGVAVTSVAMAVTSRNLTEAIRVDGLKDVITRLTTQVDKLDATVASLTVAVAKLEAKQ
jgi:uncharacterized membrane-anchored protein YhcB (DUF1043 family)